LQERRAPRFFDAMSELRWSILGVGLVVIAAVWFFSRRDKRVEKEWRSSTQSHADREPYLGDYEPAPATAAVAAESEPAREEPPPRATATDEQLILTLHVAARSDQGFDAYELARAMTAAGLKLGRYGIYHCTGGEGEGDWFSAANMVEPGRFPEPGSGGHAPGITLFMMMPGIARPQDALDALVAAARRLAVDLDGKLADGRHRPFTAQAAQRMREQLADFQARHNAI
jgi:cell division protein ZipA